MGTGSMVESQSGSATTEITKKVAAAEECEVSDLPPLFHVVDTEAINSLADSKVARIQFEYYSHEILIEDGEVTVDPA